MKICKLLGVAALFAALAASSSFAAGECPGAGELTWKKFRDGTYATPTPEERGELQDLIAEYAWVMDNRDFVTLPDLFLSDGRYHFCEMKNKDAIKSFTPKELAAQFQGDFQNLQDAGARARRTFGGVLIGKDKATGDFEVAISTVVFLQVLGVTTAHVDYMANIYATVSRDKADNLLKFKALKVAPDQAGIVASAR